jgi:hypothetical protein
MIRPIRLLLAAVLLALAPRAADAQLKVVTSTTDLYDIARAVGGDNITASHIGEGYQDPHFIEAKPSFVLQLRKADVWAFVGLDLEIGWMPLLLQGARNSKLQPGQPGYLDVSKAIPVLDMARLTTERRGATYEGFWRTTRPSVMMPGRFFHDHGIIRKAANGLLEFKVGGAGLLFEGWLLPAEGAAFTVLLPKGTLAAPDAAPDLAFPGGSGLVLVVEDEAILRQLATTALTHLGYRAVTACDGVERVDVFRARHHELVGVLLDLKMPVRPAARHSWRCAPSTRACRSCFALGMATMRRPRA